MDFDATEVQRFLSDVRYPARPPELAAAAAANGAQPELVEGLRALPDDPYNDTGRVLSALANQPPP